MHINDIIDVVEKSYSSIDVSRIMRAYVCAAKLHVGQVRRSGESFLSHPLAVAAILTEMKLDIASICAGLLHDTVEDTDATLSEIAKLMGDEVAFLVDGVTKITELTSVSPEVRQAGNLRKMILAMAGDIRVLLIKLADRLHNMRTLGYLDVRKQRKIALETREIYAPMTHRMGIRRWQTELEDLAFYYLEPEVFKRIREKIAICKNDRDNFKKFVVSEIKKKMIEHEIKCVVSGRAKHFASVYHKMIKREVDVNELYDIIAFRVIVDSLRDCYKTLGVIHLMWKPIPGRFRDYIGMPKPNGYQSLHTVVVGPMGQRMEVQIRTEKMHQVAEIGIAAHWRYKENEVNNIAEQQRFTWLRRLLDWQKESKNPSDFLQSLRMDLYPEEIFVFTPNGDVKELPRSATPLDFAYAIHTEVGNKCVGAKVNGRMVPLKRKLNTGDQVEIVTKANHKPSKDWLNFVVSGRARSKIRSFIRESERDKAIDLGRNLLDRELRKRGVAINTVIKDGKLDSIIYDFSLKSIESLLAAVAYGKISPRHLVNRIFPSSKKNENDNFISFENNLINHSKSESGVKIRGVENVLLRFARCCNPLPGDSIEGYITRGKGVTVHNSRCSYLEKIDVERRVDLEWDVSDGFLRPTRFQVVHIDRSGILADLTVILKKNGINILKAEAYVSEKNHGITNFLIEIKNVNKLHDLFKDLRNIKEVISIKRLGVDKT